MIDVLITFDIEFSIGGAFSLPNKYTPLGKNYVWLEKNGESCGLGYILKTLSKHNLKGVFFVEACNTAFHGLDEMGNIAKAISNAGHDAQLHIHPVWMHYSSNRKWEINDSCAGRNLDELEQIIEFGALTYEKWLGVKPVGIRTGSLHVDEIFYRALESTSISISSSIGLSVFKPQSENLHLFAGSAIVNNKLELPITTTVSNIGNNKSYRSLQILSCSLDEMINSLESAFENNISPVVILSHPFEYVRSENFRYENFVINPLTRNRLDGLCKYLNSNKNRFRTRTLTDYANSNSRKTVIAHPSPTVKARTVFRRMVENFATDKALDLQLLLLKKFNKHQL